MDAAVRETTYSQAIPEATSIATDADQTVILMGEDSGIDGGFGVALIGLKPTCEVQFADFATLAVEPYTVPIGKAGVRRQGRQVTIVSIAIMANRLRLGGAECPIPYNLKPEKAAVPQVATMLDGLRKLTGGLV